MLLKSDCYMEKFSDLYGTTAFQGTPPKKSKKINVPNSPLLYKPTPQRFRWLRRITLRKSTHIPTYHNMPYCYIYLQTLQDNSNNYTVFQKKIEPYNMLYLIEIQQYI